MKTVPFLALVGLCCSIACAGALYQRFTQTNAVRVEQARAWHAVICDIERATLRDKKITPGARRRAIRFFQDILVNDIHTTPCVNNKQGVAT